MVQSFKQTKDIPYYMCDRTHNMTLSMLVNVLLDVSEKQSIQLKRDESVIKGMGYSWIIIHYEFFINRMPTVNETVEIETFATEYNKLFTYRDFIVRDKENNELITVKTTFALMNTEKRKMARLPQEIVDPYEAVFSKRIRRSTKATPVEKSTASQKSYHVRYFDIDTNNHVNNSQYINWLLDSLDSSFLSSHKITHGVISFDKEVNEKDKVYSFSSNRFEDGEVYTDHQIVVEDTVNCTASFKWKDS